MYVNAPLRQYELLHRQMAVFTRGTASGYNTVNFGEINHSVQSITERTSVRKRNAPRAQAGRGGIKPAALSQGVKTKAGSEQPTKDVCFESRELVFLHPPEL